MQRLARLVFGRTVFQESEEYLEFQFRFLILLMISGAAFTALFLFAAHFDINRIDTGHIYAMRTFTITALTLWLVLRGRKQLFYPVAWIYEIVCLFEYIAAMIMVPADELRILWLYINIPGVYILLGARAGLFITVLTITGLIFGNPHLSAPYSPNAMATAIISMIYLAMFFHVYGDRSISYFERMREYNRKLHAMATRDPLTGLFNARAYYEFCDRMIRLAERNKTPYAVLFVDLDHFKSINDVYGHAAGDVVLKSVAQDLSRNIRKSDAVGRIGGEEFSIFLPNTETSGAMQIAETIRKSIENLKPETAAQPLKITASIGVARNQHSEQSMQEIQRQADQAMYQAKKNGRNRVSFFNEASQTGALPA